MSGNAAKEGSKISYWTLKAISGSKYDIILYEDIIKIDNKDVKLIFEIDEDIM